MSMSVVLLGTGAVRPVPGREGPAQVVDIDGEVLLFDCGRGAVTGLRRAGLPPEQVNKVFLTHLHFDHVSDLPYLVLTTWVIGREREVELYGPPGTGQFVDLAVRGAYAEDIRTRFAHGRSDFGLNTKVTEVTENAVVLETERYSVRATSLAHADMHNLGYRVESAEGVVVVFGDVDRRQDLAGFVRGADLLLCECSGTREFLQHPSRPWGTWHMTPADVAGLARRAGVKKVVLKHFVMEDEESIARIGELVREGFAGETIVGEDGMEISLD